MIHKLLVAAYGLLLGVAPFTVPVIAAEPRTSRRFSAGRGWGERSVGAGDQAAR